MSGLAGIVWSPLLPWSIAGPVLALVGLALLAGLLRRARGMAWRLAAALVLAGALANPTLVHEERAPIPDVAVVVLDQSPSQGLGQRQDRMNAAWERLRPALEALPDLDVRVVSSGGQPGDTPDETRLFDTLAAATADVPRRRLAGALLLTDGEVHDVPAEASQRAAFGPLHVLLTGEHDERDRRLTLVNAPSFGLVNETASVTVQVDDLPGPLAAGPAAVTATLDGQPLISASVPPGQPFTLDVPIRHAGPNVLEVETAAADREISLANNRVAVAIGGVRDRLRVLLVSGEPNPGERAWRNILKSDPSVDLVHFTILRPPEKQDATPIDQLSLIAFPIRELFELRLEDFDLIIFDRYRRRGLLPSAYLANIADFVRHGGAFLEASGPDFASAFSLYRSPLGAVLPGEPTGDVYEEGFRPAVTELGQRHPVTAALQVAAAGNGPASWGRWFRQVDVMGTSGMTVMSGAAGKPLLILDRVGRGRVAQLTSDEMWLWSRGFEGGGPQAELLRRLAHWLMQEPELEEEELTTSVDGTRIRVARRSLGDAPAEVAVTAPSGATATLALAGTGPGRAEATYVADQPGIYRFTQGELSALAVVGVPNPPELADMRTTEAPLQPAVDDSGGSVHWLADGTPGIRLVPPDRATTGPGWIGLRRNGDYTVTGVTEWPLMPAVAVLLLAAAGLLGGWFREGR